MDGDEQRDDRAAIGQQFETVPNDVVVAELDHLAEDGDHVVEMKVADIARLQTIVKEDFVQDGDVLQDEDVGQAHSRAEVEHDDIGQNSSCPG